MASPFVVNVSALKGQPGETKSVDVIGHIEGMKTTESWVADDADVVVTVELIAVPGGAIEAKGIVEAPWAGECRRCLIDVGGSLKAKVKEAFTVEEAEDTYEIVGDEIDLEPMARDALVLALPLAPLCKEDCKGLCDQCGANLNDEPDHQHLDLTDPRWDVLNDLKPDNN